MTSMSVATKNSWKDAQGEGQSHRVIAFGELAEYATTLMKGTHVMIQGAVQSREYEKDGMMHRTYELRAETIAKCRSRRAS